MVGWYAEQQVVACPLPPGQDQLAGLRVDLLDDLARVEADAPVREHAGEGVAEDGSGGGHRERLGGADVDGHLVPQPAPAQQRLGEERGLVRRRRAFERQPGDRHHDPPGLESAQRARGSGGPVEGVQVMRGAGEAGHRAGIQVGAKRDDQAVERDLGPGRLHPPAAASISRIWACTISIPARRSLARSALICPGRRVPFITHSNDGANR
jgi:hypothetical protein